METKIDAKLSSRNLWGYAIGAIPAGLLVFVFTLKYIEFFYDKLRLDPILFIVGQVIYMIINALNDPLLGQLSDRTNRKRWGSRRIIYIKYGAPIWAFTFMLLWIPWSFDNQIVIFFHYVISICLFDTLLTLVVLVWMALLPEMTSDLDERNKANFLATVLGALIIIPLFIIIAEMDPTSPTFLLFMIIIAIVSTILLWVVSYLCNERLEYQDDKPLPFWRAVKETVKMKSYILYIGYNFCGVFLSSIGLSYLFIWGFILGDNYVLTYFVILIVVGYGSNILCMKLRSRWGMKHIILRFGWIKVGASAVLYILLILYQDPLIALIAFILGTFFGGYGVFTTPLMYLSIDEDEINQGTRREGMFLGINALITKPANSLGPIVATIILEIFLYNKDSVMQPPIALIGIDMLFLLIPAIITAISLIFIYYYPHYGNELEEMRNQLEIVHQEKRQNIS
jgi:GPH family glycoside/pentoside/hexuronide:cation symporter